MKQLKKLLVAGMCICFMLSVTACGNTNTADDNGAQQSEDATGAGNAGSENKDQNNDHMNDATDDDKGMVDEIGDDIKDGVDEAGDDIRDAADDAMNNNKDENKR